MKRFLIYMLLYVMAFPLLADNLVFSDKGHIVAVDNTTATVEFGISWKNSWHNVYNYDAVYIFGKYKVEGDAGWYHMMIASAGCTVDEGYDGVVSENGVGAFVYRSTKGKGTSSVRMRLQWLIGANRNKVLDKALFDGKKVIFSLHSLEMVYVPTSPFYAGDGSSSNSFSQSDFGIFPPEHDLIGTNNYTYTGNGSETAAAHVNRPADRYNQGEHLASNRHDWCGTTFPAYWQVDFKTPKTILYFGVSGVCWQDYPCAPSGTWYLEGSANATTWTSLWDGDPEDWNQSSISYPVQRRLKVKTPGSYRYYRIRADNTQNTHLWNNIRISNVSMTDTDLGQQPSVSGILQTGLSSSLPSNYPTGVTGFYSMKYELSQEQYVAYLNQQPRSAQYVRTIGGLLDGLSEGDYVFGDNHTRASSRNGIIVHERRLNSGSPYLFACNLNPSNLANSLDDGQNLACNYLSPSDLLSYADWSGLRPLSELEYEKMCRGYYPAHPAGGAYSWETTSLTPATSVTNAGTETETPQGSTSNANAGGFLPGPARTGLFVRPGSRLQSGTSYWGLSDLSGNLSEIYCNTELYGRQLNRTVHGGGSLAENGSHTVPRSAWPQEADAYGVRGGDYTSSSSSLSVSDRSHAVGYFRSLTDRQATVGFRLGYSHDPLRSVSVLTLENGRTSGNVIVYDTVCDASEYTIRGDKPGVGDEPCHYIWYRSMDEGITWQKLENNHCHLKISGMTHLVGMDTVCHFLYKRLAYSAEEVSESQTVGLVVSYGYQINRLVDTIQPCNLGKGIEIKTLLPASFEWQNLTGDIPLKAVNSEHSSYYKARLKDLIINDGMDKEYELSISVMIANRCRFDKNVKIVVLPYTKNPFSPGVEKISYENKDTWAIKHSWTGDDRMSWKIIDKGTYGLSLDSLTGVLSGLLGVMCYEMTVELTCADYPDKHYYKKIVETERTYSYTGNYQALKFPPGVYSLECWGAEGGLGSGEGNPVGYGGYTKGELNLSEEQTFYLYVGEYGSGQKTSTAFNGGGAAYSTSGHNGGRGGGASDVRIRNGVWNDRTSLLNRIMVAGGGGGAMPNCGGVDATAGYGGGLTGGTSWNRSGSYVNNTSYGGTQTAGGSYKLGSSPNNNGVVGGLGVGAVAGTCAAGGGSGYYGGGSLYTSGGGGGSSFISGYPACNAMNASGVHTGQPVHFSGLQFTNMLLLGGDQSSVNRTPDGNGQIVIRVLSY